MGALIHMEDGKLLFIEKLTFQAPYQAIKFDNRVDPYLLLHIEQTAGLIYF